MDKSESNNIANFMKGLLVVAIGLAAYGVYCLVQSPRVQQQARALPRLTCAQLVENGAGPHRYVVMTDVGLSRGKSVSERDGETGALEMYHPIYSGALAQEPAPRDLVMILCVMGEMERRRIRDELLRPGGPGGGELTGEVKKGADHLPPWAREGLVAQYPGMVLPDCWVITVGNDEPTTRRADRLLRYGIAALLTASTMFVGWGIWRHRAVRAGREVTECGDVPP